ncbi:MAG: GAF and ANTAR domain-containing protein [Thermodesulfobacteriota bacterium]|nr:GAF and ANTAR domain-containing protein [Thermodesulfobacteriota bacterium]
MTRLLRFNIFCIMGEEQAVERHIEALSRISKAIASDRYIEDILRLVVTVTAETMHSTICSLWLLDDNDNVLKLRATQSISEAYLKERSLKMGEGIVGQVAQTRRPRSCLNVLEEPDFKEKELAEKEGLVSVLSVPMVVKDRVIGVINCYTSSPHEFTETEENVLTTVANEAAVAIENTELMVKTKVIQEELQARKLIERAKDLLMTRRGLSGPDAYRWIQRRSMDTRKSMREVSEAIILTEEV